MGPCHTGIGRHVKESGKERLTGRRLEAQRRKQKQGCRWRRCEEEDSEMQGQIRLYVGRHCEDKTIRMMPLLLQLWKMRENWWGETEDLHQSRDSWTARDSIHKWRMNSHSIERILATSSSHPTLSIRGWNILTGTKQRVSKQDDARCVFNIICII